MRTFISALCLMAVWIPFNKAAPFRKYSSHVQTKQAAVSAHKKWNVKLNLILIFAVDLGTAFKNPRVCQCVCVCPY